MSPTKAPLDRCINPIVAARLDSLSPEARARYEIMAAGWREEWALERVARAEIASSLRLSFRESLARSWEDIREGLSIFAGIAAIFVGGAGLLGTCIGVVFALVRAGWRAGASL